MIGGILLPSYLINKNKKEENNKSLESDQNDECDLVNRFNIHSN